jgi:hypothetical protein
MKIEGINSIQYSINDIENTTFLFTKILVSYDEKKILSINYWYEITKKVSPKKIFECNNFEAIT